MHMNQNFWQWVRPCELLFTLPRSPSSAAQAFAFPPSPFRPSNILHYSSRNICSPSKRPLTAPHCTLQPRQNPPTPSTSPSSSPSPASSSLSSASNRKEAHPPSEVQPLPQSSQRALQAAICLAVASLGIPLFLTVHDTFADPTIPFWTHLTSYASHFKVVLASFAFGTLHSGLASLRPRIASIIGERPYRIIFALASLPSAVALITYFISHRYDGVPLFGPYAPALQSIPLLHPLVYTTTFISFLFLYPATFNLLEVAAIQKPSFRIYERGITRITRHPQLTGQVLWCIAHTLWIGSSFTLVTSLSLIAHHCLGAWNGDRRLCERYGDEWREYAERTSILPFVAVARGKQTVRVREFVTPAYVGVVLATLGFYAAHPAMLGAIQRLHW